MGQEQVVEVSAEQAADRAALQAAAMEGGGPVPAGEVEAAPAGPSLDQELTGLVLAFVAIAKPILPSLGEIYTEEATAQAAGVVAALCKKHGWLQGGLMGDYAEEVAAAVVLLPLGIATHAGVKRDLDERKRIEQKKAADFQAHLAITRNLDGKTDLAPGPLPVGAVQGWQPPAGGAVENG